MARIRVASTAAGAESSRAIHVLFRWARRYADRQQSQLARNPASSDVLIEQTHARQVAARDKAFERQLPFSWVRFFVGLVSLVLVFSDIFRGGLGVSNMETYYPALQPDEVLGFGTSWNYSVFAVAKDAAIDKEVSVWSYKFDSTSVAWRAFARHFAVPEFPDCLLYREECPGLTFGGDVVFKMIDSLVTSLEHLKDKDKLFGPVGLTLRTESVYIDRLHQFLLPKWFTNFNWRSNQALYYSPELLATTNARTICFPANGHRVKTPRFCHELWSNLDRACAPTDTTCRAAGLLYVHTMKRLRELQTRFPNATLDLTFLESQEDLQVCRGGLSSLGFRRSDVSTIVRARECSGSSCETVFLEDYRYETGLLVSDVVQWYRSIAFLRATGQCYFWLRGLGLMLSCYFVHDTLKFHKKMTISTRLYKARQLFMKVPTQCIVYGSPFPMACYVLAHFLDAPFTYNVLESHFFSQAGVLDIEPQSFVTYAVVQMRSVWVYALFWHVVVSASAYRGLTHSKNLNGGILGVPEFLLSFFSSITLVAQYRSTSFRSSRIIRMMELPGNVGRAWEAAKYQYSFNHRGAGSVLLGGVIIDFKFLICFLFLVAAIWAVHVAWSYFWAYKFNEGKHPKAHWILFPPTAVPYSAGELWPIVSVCVQWPSAFYCIKNERRHDTQLLRIVRKKQDRQRHPFRSRLPGWKHPDARVVASRPVAHCKYLPEEVLRRKARFAQEQIDTYRYIQHQLRCLHRRSDEVEANVAFINAVLLSDPLVYLLLMIGTGRSSRLAYYQSVWHPRQILLLPMSVVDGLNEHTSGLRQIQRVNAAELTWSELVQCG
jgi:hypothetical protein